jgi:hypothetical protein
MLWGIESATGEEPTMGYTTDFIGHVDIEPPLNDAEQAYLAAFAASRRWRRPNGPYAVPGNPAAEEEHPSATEDRRINEPPNGQPGLWCDWVPCWDGCCLAYNGHEKFYSPTRWMSYLIEHFLIPGAHAAGSGLPQFEEFTFDHRLDGIVAGCRRDNKELFLIHVEASQVSEEILRPADRRFEERELLAYEKYKDEWAERSPRRRRRRLRTAGGDS